MDSWKLAIHLISFALWTGSMTAVGIFLAGDTPDGTRAKLVMRFVALPAMLGSWVTGLWVLIPSFGDVYAKAGWMHTKLLLVVLLSGLHGVLSKKARENQAVAPWTAWAIPPLLVGIVLLVTLRPF